jgi:hypothetical protein
MSVLSSLEFGGMSEIIELESGWSDMNRIGQSFWLFLGGAFLLGWSYYDFTHPYSDMWRGKIAGEIAALGAVMVAVSVWLPFRRKKSN